MGIKDIIQAPVKPVSTEKPAKLSDVHATNPSPTEFQNLLTEQKTQSLAHEEGDLTFSSHASKRLKERSISMDGDEFLKLKEAIGKLKDKGGKDSLVVTKNAAYIIDVARGKVVTAMDKDQMNENVFTKIDSTLFIN